VRRRLVRLGVRLAPVGHRSDDLRDDLAGALHLHPVADAEVLVPDQLEIVQRRQLHDRTADLDGLEHGERVDRARAADVDLDVQELRFGDVRRELARDGPAWLTAANDAKLLLER
jgi:hypothetical protein